MSLPLIVLIYLVTGCVAGGLAGLFGVGGGIVIVPVLTILFGTFGFAPSVQLKLAVGTSMAVVALTSIMSARTHHSNGNVDAALVRLLLPFVLGGVVVGALIGASVPRLVLFLAVVAFEIVVAMQFLVDAARNSSARTADATTNAAVKRPVLLGGSIVFGGISSVVGIAGGSLFVPFLTYCGSKMRTAIGTAAALGIPVGFVAAIIYFVTGTIGHEPLPPYAAGYIYIPAFAGCLVGSLLTVKSGAALGRLLNVRQLKAAFAFVLLVGAAKMMTGIVS